MAHTIGEIQEIIDTIDLAFLLAGQELLDSGLHIFFFFEEKAQRATVNGHALDVVQIQPMLPEQFIQRRDREVAEVLVVDRVEFHMIDEIHHIGHFNDSQAILLQDRMDAGNKAIQIRDVGQDIVGQKDIGLLAFVRSVSSARSWPKKVIIVGMPASCAAVAGALAGSMPCTGMPLLSEILQHIAVVAGRFHDQAVLVQDRAVP